MLAAALLSWQYSPHLLFLAAVLRSLATLEVHAQHLAACTGAATAPQKERAHSHISACAPSSSSKISAPKSGKQWWSGKLPSFKLRKQLTL